MKFGGASVATLDSFSKIAKIIIEKSREFQKIVVVVSAMGDATEKFIHMANAVHPNPPRREMDMLITVGERISISLLAMALDLEGINAVSLTGSQSGVLTSSNHSDARILEVRPHRIVRHLDKGEIVIVAGFQGVSREGEITTLGRGGSDTSAVALGVALFAEKVEFYKDVEGIYKEDPKKDSNAAFFPLLSHMEAFEVVSKGAKVLHPRSILLAEKNHLPLHVVSFKEGKKQYSEGTMIGKYPRTSIPEPKFEEVS